MYFLSSLRGQTAKTLICTKSGVSADSRKSAKKCRKVRRTALFAHFLCIFCAKSAVLRTFRHFLALFLESAETPLFVQINVFAVWPLRLDRKYTRLLQERRLQSTLYFSHRPSPLINSTLRTHTLQGVDFGSILGQVLVSFGQK